MSRKSTLLKIAASLLAAIAVSAVLNCLFGLIPVIRQRDSEPAAVTLSGSGLTPQTEQGFILFDDLPSAELSADTKISTLEFDIKNADGSEPALYELELRPLNDDGEGTAFWQKEELCIDSKTRHYRISIKDDFSASDFVFRINELTGFVYVSGLKANAPACFGFNLPRFALLCAILSFAALCFALKLYKIRFDLSKASHRGFAAACVLACVVFSVAFSALAVTGPTEPIDYPLTAPVENHSPYVQQFDAFMKGRLSLDVEPAEELLQLENPYDKQARDGIFYLWDRAFYNGSYYSYFGIAPIITLYAPWYALTGSLPADRVVLGIFSALGSAFFALSVIEWVSKFRLSVSPPLLFTGIFSSLCCTGIFLFSRGKTPFYFIAVVAASAFISAFAFFALTAFFENRTALRRILMVLAGLSFALAFLSRINSVIPAAAMILCAVTLCFIKALKGGKGSLPGFVIDMGLLALPVVGGVFAACVFNYLRFGNPLEFGTTYQLTVSDVSQNSIYAAGLYPAMYHYFTQSMLKTEVFPFRALNFDRLPDYGRGYTYIDSNIGVFNFPVCTCAALFPLMFFNKGKAGEKLIIISGAAAAAAAAYIDFCLGGVIFRYLADISVVLAFIGAAVLFNIASFAANLPKAAGIPIKLAVTCIFIFALVPTLVISNSLSLNLMEMNPETYTVLKSIFLLK